jgi:hypothetical protein
MHTAGRACAPRSCRSKRLPRSFRVLSAITTVGADGRGRICKLVVFSSGPWCAIPAIKGLLELRPIPAFSALHVATDGCCRRARSWCRSPDQYAARENGRDHRRRANPEQDSQSCALHWRPPEHPPARRCHLPPSILWHIWAWAGIARTGAGQQRLGAQTEQVGTGKFSSRLVLKIRTGHAVGGLSSVICGTQPTLSSTARLCANFPWKS